MARCLDIATQIAGGLSTAHEHGIVHRDLKPANVIIDARGHAKLIDFGLAKLLERGSDERGDSETALDHSTRRGTILGTVSYMSPEQARGAVVDQRSDIWSFGVVLYEMLSGRRPFAGASSTDVLTAILRDAPPPLSASRPVVTPAVVGALQQIVDKCLAKDQEARYQQMREVLLDLQTIRPRLEPATGERDARGPRVRLGRLIAAGAAVVLLLLGIGAAVRWWPRDSRSAETPRSTSREMPVSLRRAVAVVGFRNLSGRQDVGWLSTALAQMFAAELAAGGSLRTIPGETVARMRLELALADAETFGRETLARIRSHVGCDVVLLGSYLAIGDPAAGRIRLDLQLQDAVAGETIAVLSETGTQEQLLELVSTTGAQLRQRLGAGAAPPDALAGVRATLPSNREAARAYAEALDRLRRFDMLGARDLLVRAVALEPTHALSHAALGTAWAELGYDERARASASKAFDLSSSLLREERLFVEARYRETTRDWARAVEIYRSLVEFFPDDVEYRLRLAGALTSADRTKDALATLDGIRRLPPPLSTDPRVDVAEAEANPDPKRMQQVAAAAAAAVGEARGMPLLAARALIHEGFAWRMLGEFDKALAAAGRAKARFEKVGDRWGLSESLDLEAAVRWSAGALDAAQDAATAALEIQTANGDRRGMSNTLSTLAAIAVRRGDLDGAERYCERALANDDERAARGTKALTLNTLGAIQQMRGKLDLARARYDEAAAIWREAGDEANLALASVNVAGILETQGDLASAAKLYTEALDIRRRAGNRRGVSYALTRLGSLDILAARLEGARTRLDEALAVARELGADDRIAEAQLVLARAATEAGHPDQGERAAREALAIFERQKMSDGESAALDVLAYALLEAGRTDEAAGAIDRAIARVGSSRDQYVKLGVTLTAARVRAAQGRTADAVSRLTRAMADARSLGFVGPQLEARLILGTTELRAGSVVAGRERLATLEADARARGYVLFADAAAAASRRF